jgi:hypothetical protein
VDTRLIFVVDDDDPTLDEYVAEVSPDIEGFYRAEMGTMEESTSMVYALNGAAMMILGSFVPPPFAIAFMGDDHMPRTKGWDEAYLIELDKLGSGLVYGNDLLQGERLPTQVAITGDIIRTLGAMAPPSLKHLAVDNFWLELGQGADCITYLPDVIVEHMHPFAEKADMDDGYLRVNDPALYERDLREFERIREEELPAAIDAVRALRGQWKLFEGDVAEVSTAEYHKDRERARHLEEDEISRARLELAASYVMIAAVELKPAVVAEGTGRLVTVSDLGCGDGGLLSLINNDVDAWGYDFTPANIEGCKERAVEATQLDVFGSNDYDRNEVDFGDITAVTEVLEHLTDPFAAVKWIGQNSRYIVASSPWDEHPGSFTDCHAWAFNKVGYRRLIESGGFRVVSHEFVGRFQVILGVKE